MTPTRWHATNRALVAANMMGYRVWEQDWLHAEPDFVSALMDKLYGWQWNLSADNFHCKSHNHCKWIACSKCRNRRRKLREGRRLCCELCCSPCRYPVQCQGPEMRICCQLCLGWEGIEKGNEETRKTAVTASWHWLRPWCTSCLGRCCCCCTVYISVDVAIHFMHLARQGQQLRCYDAAL